MTLQRKITMQWARHDRLQHKGGSFIGPRELNRAVRAIINSRGGLSVNFSQDARTKMWKAEIDPAAASDSCGRRREVEGKVKPTKLTDAEKYGIFGQTNEDGKSS
jgi:hypothetical protein